MTRRSRRPWPSVLLGLLCIGAGVAAYLVVGAPSQSSAAASTRDVTAEQGVVQQTVSGSGNIESSSQLDLGFKTSGEVKRIYVSQGQHVRKGQLIASLDPESAEVTLEQAKASLQAAEANLTAVEEGEDEDETSAGSGSPTAAGDSSGTSQGTGSGAVNESTGATAENESTGKKESKATREANVASAKAAVRSDRLTVKSDEEAVRDTRLYAPESGTIVALSGSVGETVSGSGTSKGSSGSSETGAAGAPGTGESSDAGNSSSSSSSFAVLSKLGSLQLVVPLSESEIGSVKVGQTATVTVEALESRKLAGHVIEVATLPSSESSVVSYDVTFRLDQTIAGVKPGMSATAEVVVKQATGVTVPSEAITGDSVTVMKGGKEETRAIVRGLAGESSTIIRDGLRAGEEVVVTVARSLPTTSSGTSSTTSGLTTGVVSPGGSTRGAGVGGFPTFRGAGGPP